MDWDGDLKKLEEVSMEDIDNMINEFKTEHETMQQEVSGLYEQIRVEQNIIQVLKMLIKRNEQSAAVICQMMYLNDIRLSRDIKTQLEEELALKKARDTHIISLMKNLNEYKSKTNDGMPRLWLNEGITTHHHQAHSTDAACWRGRRPTTDRHAL
jgi:hypothetical protein